MKCPDRNERGRRIASILSAVLAVATASTALGQAAAAPAAAPEAPKTAPAVPTDQEVFVLSPFVVTAEEDSGYVATSTLAGTRLRSDLRDVGAALSVVTEQFLKDTNSRNVEDLLVYTTNTEIGGTTGNYSGIGLGTGGGSVDETGNFTRSNTNSRIRGIGGVENTRDFFSTDIPSDSYNTGRFDIQRGPNSILFGLGSPAGVINSGLNQASFRNSTRLDTSVDGYGGFRASLDFNRVLLSKQLAIRIDLLNDAAKYRQKPTFKDDKRVYAALRWDPKLLARNGMNTTVRVNFEHGEIMGMNPRTLPPIDRISLWFNEQPLVVGANPYIGKPEQRYPAVNRSLYDNWKISGKAVWSDPNWNPSGAYSFDPTSDVQGYYGRVWVNPASPLTTKSRTYVPGWVPGENYTGVIYEVSTGGAMGFYAPGSTFAQYSGSNATTQYGLNAGSIYNTKNSVIGAVPDGGIGSLRGGNWFAIQAPFMIYKEFQLPYGSKYRDWSMINRDVFDFVNNNLDADTRRNWRGWDSFNATIDQTFFHNRAGFTASADHQRYHDGSHSIFNDRTQTITVDLNQTLPSMGRPNPNAGKAVMVGDGNYRTAESKRKDLRVNLFAELRATDFLSKGLLSRILGRHVITGLASRNIYETKNRSYKRFMMDPNDLVGIPRDIGASDSQLSYRTHVYLSNDVLTDRTKYPTMSSLHLQAPTFFQVPETVQLQYFDSHWNKPLDPAAAGYVNPGAPWLDPWGLNPNLPLPISNSTQRNNPANYIGYTTKAVHLLDASKDEDLDRMIRGYGMNRMRINSRAFVWQGFFFNGDLVPTFGYRQDTAKAYTFSDGNAGIPGRGGVYRPKDITVTNNRGQTTTYLANPLGVKTEDGFIIEDSPYLALPETPNNSLRTISRSWSLVGHVPNVIRKHLPWGTAISLSFNRSSNFSPNDASRKDLWGNSIAPSGGKTTDFGILVSTLENRLSFRVVRYKSAVERGSLGIPGQWAQIEGRSYVAAKKMQDAIKAAETKDYLGNPLPGATVYSSPWENPGYLYGTIDPTDTNRVVYANQAEKDALLTKGRNMVKLILDNVPPDLAKAWNMDLASETWRTVTDYGSFPPGATSLQNRSSKGWEYEMTVRPLKNWRISGNMSTTEATQSGSYSDIVGFARVRNEFWNGPAGAFYYDKPGREAGAYRDDWNINVMGTLDTAILGDGMILQEGVRRRFNIITSYEIQQGFFKGLTIGGGYRWEDKAAIGYYYKTNLITSGTKTFVQEVADKTKPIYGKELKNTDLWIGYKRKVFKNVNWRVQLNIRNLGDAAQLIPISTQPTGEVAQYRIKDGMSWTLTNAFEF